MIEKLKKSKKAFTLVEMLIVVVIIGILSSALIPRLQGAQARARDTARTSHLNQLATALSVRQSDKGAYPDVACATNLQDSLIPRYIKNIPSDPQSQRSVQLTGESDSASCNSGSYGYLPLMRNGADNGGMVVVANIESEGQANWVWSGTAQSAGFKKEWTDATEAQELEQYVCDNEVIIGSGNSYCDWSTNDGIAKNNAFMQYVQFQ